MRRNLFIYEIWEIEVKPDKFNLNKHQRFHLICDQTLNYSLHICVIANNYKEETCILDSI